MFLFCNVELCWSNCTESQKGLHVLLQCCCLILDGASAVFSPVRSLASSLFLLRGWQGLIAQGCHSSILIIDPKTAQTIQVLERHKANVVKVSFKCSWSSRADSKATHTGESSKDSNWLLLCSACVAFSTEIKIHIRWREMICFCSLIYIQCIYSIQVDKFTQKLQNLQNWPIVMSYSSYVVHV